MIKPETNDYVMVFFRNGTSLEGFVENWSEDQSVIRSKNSNNILIIQNTFDDVMFVKICRDNTAIPKETHDNNPHNRNPAVLGAVKEAQEIYDKLHPQQESPEVQAYTRYLQDRVAQQKEPQYENEFVYGDIDVQGDSNEERIQNLIELRQKQKEAEAEIFQRRARSFAPSTVSRTQYGYPSQFQPQPITNQHSRAQDQDGSVRNRRRMQALSRQKS